MRCSFAGCQSSNKRHGEGQLGFHKYPKDIAMCKLWIEIGHPHDDLNLPNARVCGKHFTSDCYKSNFSYKKYLRSDALPTLFLPPSYQIHPAVKARRKQVKEAASKLPNYTAPPPFATGHDYFFVQKNQPSQTKTTIERALSNVPEFIVKGTLADAQPVQLDRLCRFCLTESKDDLVRIAWDEWQYSNLTLLYEQITNTKLQISAQCSELYCNGCSQRLHDTFLSIQMLRETHEFWQGHLEATDEQPPAAMAEVNTDNFIAEYLDNSSENDVIYVEQPIEVNTEKLKCDENRFEQDDTYDDFEYPESVETVANCSGPTDVVMSNNLSAQVFNCEKCQKEYKTTRGLAEHMQAQHESKALCKLCNKTMSTTYGLRKHLQVVHEQKESIECKICGKFLSCYANWKSHQRVHTRSLDTVTACDECDKVFCDRVRMKTHKRNVHGPYVASMCNVCGKVLRNKTRLRVHMLLHDPVKPKCEHCQTEFSTKKSIIEHMIVVHKQGTPHICEQCGRQFQCRQVGRKHSLTCTGKIVPGGSSVNYSRKDAHMATVKCILCGAGFAQLGTLHRHYIKRHEPKHFESLCMQCNQMLDSPVALADHKRTVHSNLQCKVCKKMCLSLASLRIHMDAHEDGKPRFECDICGGSYARLLYLKMHHRRVHTTVRPFECKEPDCNRAFAENFDLTQHILTRHTPISERPHKCEVCGERFSIAKVLRTHMSKHTGIGIWKCDECNKNFMHNYQLRAHIVSDHSCG